MVVLVSLPNLELKASNRIELISYKSYKQLDDQSCQYCFINSSTSKSHRRRRSTGTEETFGR